MPNRLRWLLIPAVVAINTILLAELGTIVFVAVCATMFGIEGWMWEAPLRVMTTVEGWRLAMLPAAVATMTQGLFLFASAGPIMSNAGRGRSLSWTLLGAGFVVAMLFLGLLCAAGEAVHWVVTGHTDIVEWADRGMGGAWIVEWGFGPFLILSWLMWTPVLLVFARRRPRQNLAERLVGWLLAGTIVEVAVVLPLDIMVRRKTDCYCATGTFWSLVMSGLSLLWLTGPGIVLAMTSKRRRWWAQTHCVNCGYAKGPSHGTRCPECGAAWSRAGTT